MHIWVVEIKRYKDSTKWEQNWFSNSRQSARNDLNYAKRRWHDARVVKYISTKGE